MKHVVDAHALLWFVGDSPRLGAAADAALSDPTSELILPAIALAEALWTIERGRVPLAAADVLSALDADGRFSIAPLDRATIERSSSLTSVGEMHDRQIVATTLLLIESGEAVSLITHDANITASGVVPIVW